MELLNIFAEAKKTKPVFINVYEWIDKYQYNRMKTIKNTKT